MWVQCTTLVDLSPQSRPVQTAIKDSFVWVMGPQRFVTLTL